MFQAMARRFSCSLHATPYCREALHVETLPDRPTVIGGHFKWYTDNTVCATRPSSHPLDCLFTPLAAPSGPCAAREGTTAVDACDAAHDPGGVARHRLEFAVVVGCR